MRQLFWTLKTNVIQLNLSKTATLKRPKIGFQDQFMLNADQKSIAECSKGNILQYFRP